MVREKQQRHSGQFRGKLQEEPPLKQPCPCLSLLAHQRNPVDFTGEFSLWVEQERIELPPEGFTLRKDGEVTRTRTLQRLGIRPHTIGDEIDDRTATRRRRNVLKRAMHRQRVVKHSLPGMQFDRHLAIKVLLLGRIEIFTYRVHFSGQTGNR